MTHPIINIADVDFQSRLPEFSPTGDTATRFDMKIARIGGLVGAQQLGYNITAIPPGKCAFPLHCHHVNEEMFFVLQGSGEVRIGDTVYPIRTGDIIACLAGGVDTAHQIRNTGSDELRFLAVSTTRTPELCEYPDSGKFGVYATFAASDTPPKVFGYLGREDQSLDYWDDE